MSAYGVENSAEANAYRVIEQVESLVIQHGGTMSVHNAAGVSVSIQLATAYAVLALTNEVFKLRQTIEENG
jgi:hypothetical protein